MADEQPEHDQAAEGASIGELEQGMRLMKVKDSGKGDKPKQTKAQKKRAWVEARNTRVVEHFTTHYGADKLECWQAVSRKIGVEVGKTSNACKTVRISRPRPRPDQSR